MTLSINSVIIYSEVYRWDFNERWFDDEENEPPYNHQILDFRSEERFQELNLNLEHLTRLPNRSTFGYACGAGAQMPEEGQQMIELVENKDTRELTNWLNSVNPVRQAYAYLGFSLLLAQGTEIDVETTAQMNELKPSGFLIYSCSGCTLWEPIPLAELLTDENVERFIGRNTK